MSQSSTNRRADTRASSISDRSPRIGRSTAITATRTCLKSSALAFSRVIASLLEHHQQPAALVVQAGEGLGETAIREVIAFPLNQQGEDLLMNAPTEAQERQLKDVHIRTALPLK